MGRWITTALGLSFCLLAASSCKNETAAPPPDSGSSDNREPAGAGDAPGADTQPAKPPDTQGAAGTQAATWEPTEKPRPAPGRPRVELRIRQGNEDWGWIVVELDEAKAPITTRNFLRYVDEGFYNGTIFHRVMSNFMIQGGSHVPPRVEKAQGVHEPIALESQNGLKNARGTLAMARTSDPNSATTGFFINVVENPGLDHPQPDGHGYAVFGKVVEGMDVVDRIRRVPTTTNPDNPRERSMPVDPPVMVTVQRAGENRAP